MTKTTTRPRCVLIFVVTNPGLCESVKGGSGYDRVGYCLQFHFSDSRLCRPSLNSPSPELASPRSSGGRVTHLEKCCLSTGRYERFIPRLLSKLRAIRTIIS
ncbi:unnamed protein product [Choristocarpus tenellus]